MESFDKTLFDAVQELSGKIEQDVFEKISPKMMQVLDSVRNSNAVLQQELRGDKQEFKCNVEILHKEMNIHILELKDIVSQFKNDTEKRLDQFEIRLSKVEGRLWSKLHLYAIYLIIILFIAVFFNLSSI